MEEPALIFVLQAFDEQYWGLGGEGRAFSLKSVMMTVRSPTVTSRCCALLRSMFFNRGLGGGGQERGEEKR